MKADSLPTGYQLIPHHGPSHKSHVLPTVLLVLLALYQLVQYSGTEISLSELASDVKWALKPLPKDPLERAIALMERYPLIDGHIDLPILARGRFLDQIADIDLYKTFPGHVDIPRLREGRVGGMFHSVYVPCPEDAGYPADNNGNFTNSTWRVRDTLEQFDVARLIIEKHSDVFELNPTAKAWRKAMKKGKIGGMIGVEGGHQIGNSLPVLRMYYELGARYLTLTHTCNNALADSCGYQGVPLKERWNGLSDFGRAAIQELNRLGMLVDASHTDPTTASDALTASLAPVIFSHSNARGVHQNVRNVPDSILRRIGGTGKNASSDDGEGGKGWGADSGEADKLVTAGDAIVMLNFSPSFVSEVPNKPETRANVERMADHADYIGRLAGREHVGIGSDFDGIGSVPVGLEDVSHYPNLIAELIKRGWTDKEIAGVTSENLLRVLEKAEKVAAKLQAANKPVRTDIFSGRTDLKRYEW